VGALTIALVARVPPAGMDDYEQYVGDVLPVLATNGAVLEHRLAPEPFVEVFVISLPNDTALEAVQNDMHQHPSANLLYRSGAQFEIVMQTPESDSTPAPTPEPTDDQ